MEYILIISGILFAIAGLIGCFLPIVPGPPMSYFALVLLHFSKDDGVFSTMFLFGFLIITILVTILDYLIPSMGAKYVGASKYGTIGAFFGMIFGMILFSGTVLLVPIGMIAGTFFGTLLGEYIYGTKHKDAIRSGIASMAGFVVATVMKFSISGIMTFFYFKYI